jgi:RHS repeat-associated protein
VDVVTGEMFLPVTDLMLPGVLPLVLERRHASGYRRGQWFGTTWSSTLDQRIEIDENGIHYAAPDGRVLHFPIPTVHGQRVLPSFGPRWQLTWDRSGGRDEIRIEQGELGRTLIFLPGPTPQKCRPLSAVVDRGGDRVTFIYDAAGTPTDVYHSGGYRLRISAISTRGGTRIASIKLADPAGGADLPVREFRYDTAGRLTGVYHPDSDLAMVFDYDEHDRITRWTDRNGHWYAYTYRADGRVAAARGEGGFLDVDFDYDLAARTTTMTDGLDHTRLYYWNALGQTVRSMDPLGGERHTVQDRLGDVVSNTDPLGRTTTIERNGFGDPVRIVNPDGSGSVIDYDQQRLPQRVAHSDGRAWAYEHGPHGQVTAITDPAGAVVRFEYTERGHLQRTIDALGAVTEYVCDKAGLPIRMTDPLGAVTAVRRDGFGRITEITDPVGARTVCEWTAGGRLARRVLPDGSQERWTYDAEGNVLTGVGATGIATAFTYGPFDLPTSRTDPDGAVYRFAYDRALTLTAVTGPTGLRWTYEHDDAGRMVAECDFNGRRIDYRLDEAGQLTGRSGAEGVIEYERDLLGRLVEHRADGRATRLAYGLAGQLVRAENPESVLEYTLDPLGRVLTETVDGYTLTNRYDAAGRRIERTTPGGITTSWSYDAAGQPTRMTGTAGTLAFGYDAAGREVARLLGPGALAHRTYDAVGRPMTEGIWSYPNQDAAAPADGTVPVQLQARIFEFLPDGTPSQIQDALRGERAFTTDAAGRVTGIRASTWQAAYAYDALGNLAASRDTADPDLPDGPREITGTRIRRAGNEAFEHDEAGRVVRRTRRTISGQVKTVAYSWDAENRLTTVTLPDGTAWSYRYDPLGRRTAKTHHAADGTSLEAVGFAWDGPRLVEEYRSGTGGALEIRTWDHQPGEFTPLAQTRRSWATDAPQQLIDTEFHAIVTDLVGAPAELVAPDGTLAWHTVTSLWGAAATALGSTAECPLRFPGQYHDAETGLDYNLHRYYDPALSAYLTPDPLGLAAAPNDTAYVGNPLTSFDPLGLFSCPKQVQSELAQFRQQTSMKSVAAEDADIAAQKARGVKRPKGATTVGKMEFDGGRDPVYGIQGQLPERTAAYPGKGNHMTATSFQDHAEGDMAYQAKQLGYSGGSAAIHTDRPTCGFCQSSIRGYAEYLNLDKITVYGPDGLIGIWDQTGRIG